MAVLVLEVQTTNFQQQNKTIASIFRGITKMVQFAKMNKGRETENQRAIVAMTT
jgi:hypothetical protein